MEGSDDQEFDPTGYRKSKPDAETLERYRRMTISERLQLTMEMIREESKFLVEGPEDVVNARFEQIRRENDDRNQRMLEGIARSRNEQGRSSDAASCDDENKQ